MPDLVYQYSCTVRTVPLQEMDGVFGRNHHSRVYGARDGQLRLVRAVQTGPSGPCGSTSHSQSQNGRYTGPFGAAQPRLSRLYASAVSQGATMGVRGGDVHCLSEMGPCYVRPGSCTVDA